MGDSGGGKENGQETELRGEEQEAQPAQEDQLKSEVSPRLEGHQNPKDHTGPEILQRPREAEDKQPRITEEEESGSGAWK